MSLGNQSSITHVVTLKNMKKEDDRAYLEAYDLATQKSTQHDFVEGELIKITFGEGDYEGKKFPTCVIYLRDGEQTYKIRSNRERLTYPIRQILNRLLTIQDVKNVKISWFGQKGEYKNIAVSSNGEKLEYLISKDEMGALVEEIKDKQGEVIKRDTTDLDNVLMNKVKDVIYPLLKQNTKEDLPKADAPVQDAIEKDVSPISVNDNESGPDVESNLSETDDLPF